MAGPRIGLVLGGGGARGAFQVGVVEYLVKKEGIDTFPVISGTSTGALVGSMVCLQEWAGLQQLYTTVKAENIINPHSPLAHSLLGELGGLAIAAITGGRAIFSTQALEELIAARVDFHKIKDRASESLLIYNAINLRTAEKTTINNRQHGVKQLADGLLASASEPIFMDPVEITVGGQTDSYVDGGVRELIPIAPVYQSGEPLDGIIVVSTRPIEAKQADGNAKDVLEVLERTMELFLTETGFNDFDGAVTINALLKILQNARDAGVSDTDLFRGVESAFRKRVKNYRHAPIVFVGPKDHLGLSSLDFDSQKMRALMSTGRQRAKQLLPKFFDRLEAAVT